MMPTNVFNIKPTMTEPQKPLQQSQTPNTLPDQSVNDASLKDPLTSLKPCKLDDDDPLLIVDQPDLEKAIDAESICGRFGWASFGTEFIPYILRSGVKFVAVMMFQMKVLRSYFTSMRPEVYKHVKVKSYGLTMAEAALLNQINSEYCDGQFGNKRFTTDNLMVKLEDAEQLYEFLKVCKSKLVDGIKSGIDRCGFIRINKESVIPFVLKDGKRVVPIFYFEGEVELLTMKIVQIENWDLYYLKFCCDVQGIKKELYDRDACSVIDLGDIKDCFPGSTVIEDYWPDKSVVCHLLAKPNEIIQPLDHWTKPPSPLPS